MQNVVIGTWNALESLIYPNISTLHMDVTALVYPSHQLHELMINNIDFIITKKLIKRWIDYFLIPFLISIALICLSLLLLVYYYSS